MHSILKAVPGEWVVIGYGVFCAVLLLFLVAVFGSGVLVKVKAWFWPREQTPLVESSKTQENHAEGSTARHKPIPKYGCKYERQWHQHLLSHFDENERAYLDAVYAKRQIFGAPWEFYNGIFTTIVTCSFLASAAFVFGMLGWGGIRNQLGGLPGSFQDVPGWFENLILFVIGASGVLLTAGPMIMIAHQSLILKLLGGKPEPSLTIDAQGIAQGAQHVPWQAIDGVFPISRRDRRGNTSYDVAVVRHNGTEIDFFISPPDDLMDFMPRPLLLTVGGSVAAQFCLVALLRYCGRFHKAHYG
jgi:hypothetical protein